MDILSQRVDNLSQRVGTLSERVDTLLGERGNILSTAFQDNEDEVMRSDLTRLVSNLFASEAMQCFLSKTTTKVLLENGFSC